MDLKELQKDPKMMETMKEIGSILQIRSKQEQAENVKNFRILNENAVKGQILFTGSSLMEQFPITEIARNHGIDKIIYNRGIGVLFDLAPSKLFINIGTNDMRPREDGQDWAVHLLNNYEHILQQIKERLPECQVYMMAYYPTNPTVADNEVVRHLLATRTRENLDMINEKMAALAAKYDYHFINANDGLCDAEGYLKKDFTKEGLHMFANAYEVVFNNIKPYI